MKKVLKAVLLLLVIGGASFGITLMVLSYSNEAARVAQNAPNVLPQFSFQRMDGSEFTQGDLSKSRVTAFVFFSPGCDHCMVQGAEMGDHIADTQHIDLVFVTNESKEQINDYATAFHLADQSNVTFLYDADSEMYLLFKPDIFPSVLLYTSNGELLKGWSGVVSVEELLLELDAH